MPIDLLASRLGLLALEKQLLLCTNVKTGRFLMSEFHRCSDMLFDEMTLLEREAIGRLEKAILAFV